MTDRALSNIRILDMSRVLAGPWASQLLADLGAEVIKVERPGRGDDTRAWGPPYWQGDDNMSAYFLSANRGKRSITVDISREEGQALIRELAVKSDVLIENYKVDDLRQRGLDYDALKRLNPGLVYCSITGFGQTGPYRQRPGYDFMIQAMSGLMSITGAEDDAMGGPQKVGVAIADILTGLYAVAGILAAIHQRESTGEGQYIDLALLDVQLAALANQSLNYLVSGVAPRRLGNAHPNIVPYQSVATRDGHIILAVGNDGQFSRLCALLGRSELATHPDYAANSQRVANRVALMAELDPLFAARDSGDWLAALEQAGVPCGPINDIAAAFADPQVQARGMQLDSKVDGVAMPGVANPIRMSGSADAIEQAPPRLGEHTAAVLRDVLGYEDAEIVRLRDRGLI